MTSTTTRNPKWTRDEIILALNIYFKVNVNNLSVHEDTIIQLSELLNKLNAYDNNQKTNTYRNPSGVHMKLMNFYSIEYPGKGLKNASRLDKEIYYEFCNRKEHLESIANKITETINSNKNFYFSFEDEGFPEGSTLEKMHKSKERNPKAVRKKKEFAFNKYGYLQCEVCGFIYKDVYGELGDGYIECHHNVPLAEIDIQHETKISELSLVCANCHRMLHRKRPAITIEELKKIVVENNLQQQ